MKPVIFAVWDLETTGTGLGPFLMFQEELLMYQSLLDVRHIEIYFCTGQTRVSLSCLAGLAQLNPFLGALHFIKNRKEIFYRFPSDEIFQWPPEDVDKNCAYFGSTLHIQKLWQKTKKIFLLQSPQVIRILAENWLKKYVPDGHYPVIVHLKNNDIDTQSNANQDEWLRLFQENENLPLKFILIGNEPCDERFSDCTNCVVTQKNGGFLEMELALMQQSFFFMGMSSGPCNLAILSAIPYRIWKHPDHHSLEMERELDENGQFLFSCRNQKFIRAIDTFESLNYELNTLYQNLMRNQ